LRLNLAKVLYAVNKRFPNFFFYGAFLEPNLAAVPCCKFHERQNKRILFDNDKLFKMSRRPRCPNSAPRCTVWAPPQKIIGEDSGSVV